MYECRKCGRTYVLDEIEFGDKLRCPYCNGRIFEKTKPKTVRKVRAR